MEPIKQTLYCQHGVIGDLLPYSAAGWPTSCHSVADAVALAVNLAEKAPRQLRLAGRSASEVWLCHPLSRSDRARGRLVSWNPVRIYRLPGLDLRGGHDERSPPNAIQELDGGQA